MATPEAGHAASRAFLSQAGNLHMNGANLFDAANNSEPLQAGFTIAAGASTISLITIQVQDGRGAAIAAVYTFDVWLSDAATGAGLTGTTASGAVAAGTPGAVTATLVSKKALRVQTDATGAFQLSITDSARTTFYVACECPGTGNTFVSRILATGDYGA